MKDIYNGESDIHGLGIRTSESIKRGELIRYIKGKIQVKENRSREDAMANPDWVGISKNCWIDPVKPYKFLNHSCDPNIGIKGRVSMVALRSIKSGEELTIDYSTIEGDPRWEMKCSCGAQNCRKVVRSIQYLPERQYKKYLPYISSYFKQLYHRKPAA